jgi:hypothetical protein
MRCKNICYNKFAVSEIITALLLISIVLAASIIFIPNALRSERNLLSLMSASEEKQSQRFMEALSIIKSDRYTTDLIIWIYNYGILTNMTQLMVDGLSSSAIILNNFTTSWQPIYVMNFTPQWINEWMPINMNLLSKNNASLTWNINLNSLKINSSISNIFSEFGYVNKILYGYMFTVNSSIQIISGVFLLSLISKDKTSSFSIIFNSTGRSISIVINNNSIINKIQYSMDTSSYNVSINVNKDYMQFQIFNGLSIKKYNATIPYYERDTGYYIYFALLSSSSIVIHSFTISGVSVNPLIKDSMLRQGINVILVKNYGWASRSVALLTSTGNIWRWNI